MTFFKVLKFGILVCALILAAKNAKAETKLDRAIKKAAAEHNVDADLLWAIVQIESSGGRNVKTRHNKNGSIDVGVAQINSVHFQGECKMYNILETSGNLSCAAKLLKKTQRYTQDKDAIGRYHSRTPHRRSKYATLIRKQLAKRKMQDTINIAQGD